MEQMDDNDYLVFIGNKHLSNLRKYLLNFKSEKQHYYFSIHEEHIVGTDHNKNNNITQLNES